MGWRFSQKLDKGVTMNISKSTLTTILGAAALGLAKRHVGSSSRIKEVKIVPITVTWKMRVHYDISDDGNLFEPNYAWGDALDWSIEQMLETLPAWLNVEISDDYEDHPDNESMEAEWNKSFIEEYQDDIDGAKDALRDYLDWDDEGILEEEYENIEDLVSDLYLGAKAKQGDFWNDLSQNVTWTIRMTIPNFYTEDKINEFVEHVMEELNSVLTNNRPSGSMWWENSGYEVNPSIESFARKDSGVSGVKLRKR